MRKLVFDLLDEEGLDGGRGIRFIFTEEVGISDVAVTAFGIETKGLLASWSFSVSESSSILGVDLGNVSYDLIMNLPLEFMIQWLAIWTNLLHDLSSQLFNYGSFEVLFNIRVPQLIGFIENITWKLLVNIPDIVAAEALYMILKLLSQLAIILKQMLDKRVSNRVEIFEGQRFVERIVPVFV